MIDLIKKYFSPDDTGQRRADPGRHDVRVATCALMLEMANADGEFSNSEREHILSVMSERYDLPDEDASQLTELAREQLAGSIDLWHFTNLINQNYSQEEKVKVVEMIWRVVYADGKLTDHEHYLVGKLRKMLRVSQRELIDAKLAVIQERDGGQQK